VQNARKYAKHRKILRKNALLIKSGKRRKEDRLSVTLLLAASVSHELNDPTVDRVYSLVRSRQCISLARFVVWRLYAHVSRLSCAVGDVADRSARLDALRRLHNLQGVS
jgi:hypothetical protein